MPDHIGFYHADRGYWECNQAPKASLQSSFPSGTVEVPLQPDVGYTYDGSAWVAPSQQWLDDTAAEDVRAERNYKLRSEVDKIASNNLRWADLSEVKRQEWTDYRRALLDLPDQAGFPHSVTWPDKPA